MMAHSDVFTTVYSTMVVEAAIHERPIVSICIDQPGGWNTPRKYSLALSKIGNWPTHQRFRDSGAGKVAIDKAGLRDALNHYLRNDQAEAKERRNFIRQECTFVDGSAGKQTADFFLKIVNQTTSSTTNTR
jgi:CDP-glycerol glycerophosphotransferase (TagB/SpsB family)